jgi:hypothetical protein
LLFLDLRPDSPPRARPEGLARLVFGHGKTNYIVGLYVLDEIRLSWPMDPGFGFGAFILAKSLV